MIVYNDNYEAYEKYLIHDEYGIIIGISDEAPDDIKELFYTDQKEMDDFMERHRDDFLEAFKIARGEKKKWQD